LSLPQIIDFDAFPESTKTERQRIIFSNQRDIGPLRHVFIKTNGPVSRVHEQSPKALIQQILRGSHGRGEHSR